MKPINPIPENMDVADVLDACKHFMPVNVRTGVAIAAHREALASHLKDGEPARLVAEHALRSVVLARAPLKKDRRKRLDYLRDLPIDAWQGRSNRSAESIRESTLAMFADEL